MYSACDGRSKWQYKIPAELIQRVAYQLWYNTTDTNNYNHWPVGSGITYRRLQLQARERAILDVCRLWRHHVYSEYSKYVIADCLIDSMPKPTSYLNQYTREIWVYFCSEILFGNWAIEWARKEFCRTTKFAISKLVITISSGPNILTTEAEDERAMVLCATLVDALSPRFLMLSNEFMGRPSGDKLAVFRSHLCSIPLTAIDLGCIDDPSTLWLIRSSASTLAKIQISSVKPSSLHQLLFGIHPYLIFPSLIELMMTVDLNDTKLDQSQVSHIHFPSLEYLHLELAQEDISPTHETHMSILEYAFFVDLFLNHKSLKIRQLYFPLAWDTVELLTPDALPCLKEAILPEISIENEHTLENDESSMLINNLLACHTIQSIILNCLSDPPDLLIASILPCLHTLIIPYYHLQVDQIAALLIHLPRLSSLVCSLASNDRPCEQPLGSPHYAIRSISVNIPRDVLIEAVNALFSIITMLPNISLVKLPDTHCYSLLENLRLEYNIQVNPWSCTLLDNVTISTL